MLFAAAAEWCVRRRLPGPDARDRSRVTRGRGKGGKEEAYKTAANVLFCIG